MNCQRYRKWITDAATGHLDASRIERFKTHLAACMQCRRAFEAEQRLFAAIDRGIAARVEGTPSSQFAAGVRMRLNTLEPSRSGIAWERPSVWSPALALAGLAVVLLTLWLAHRTEHPRVAERTHMVPPSAPARQPTAPGQFANVTPSAASLPVTPRHRAASLVARRTVVQHASSDQDTQLEVLIDPGQKAAIAELVRTMQRGADPVGTVEKSLQNDDPLQVQTVQVDAVTIAELQRPKPIGAAADEGKSH